MSSNEISLEDFKFKHPFNLICFGTTQSGKTIFTKKLLENWKYLISIDKKNIKVLWSFSESKPKINVNKNLEIIWLKRLPELNDIKQIQPDIIVIDDQMDDINKDTVKIFTVDSHAYNISVIFLVQNLFNRNKFMRSITINSHYFVAMRGLRNEQQLEILTRQTFGNKSKKILEIFREMTTKPYSYLILDLHPNSKRETAIKTRIFKDELTQNMQLEHSFAPIYFDV